MVTPPGRATASGLFCREGRQVGRHAPHKQPNKTQTMNSGPTVGYGGAFLLGLPCAVTFEELFKIAYVCPVLPSISTRRGGGIKGMEKTGKSSCSPPPPPPPDASLPPRPLMSPSSTDDGAENESLFNEQNGEDASIPPTLPLTRHPLEMVVDHPLALGPKRTGSPRGQLPTNKEDVEDLQGIHAGIPIEKSQWYSRDGAKFRVRDSRVVVSDQSSGSVRSHLVYDVCFSGQSIGLTLSAKSAREHVYVQAITGVAAYQIGLICKGDIILSAACPTGWVRCNQSLSTLTNFIKVEP